MARNHPHSGATEVLATSLDDAGAGVGLVDGVAVHVGDLLPGERALVGVDHRSPHRAEAWGHVETRVGPPSPDRAAPACPAAGRCGGCAWQHVRYPAQLQYKATRVEAALAALPPERRPAASPIVAAPRTLGYRNRGKYVVGEAGGQLVLGAFAPRTHEVIDTLGCRVVAPIIDELAATIRGLAQAHGVRAYREQKRSGELRYVVVRANRHGEVLVGLVTPRAVREERLRPLGAAIARHPAVRGVVWVAHDRVDGAILPHDAAITSLAGAPTLPDEISGVAVETGIAEFLQVNAAQSESLYQHVADLVEAGAGRRLVDLFAGVGGITFAMARRGAAVTAIEIDQAAVRDLERAAAAAGLAAVRAIAGDASLLAQVTAGGAWSPDAIVVNPPRRGLHPDVQAALLAAAPPTLVYVSCGPDSLARDLAAWVAAGYRLDSITPFDLMPGTGHVETVVRARRAT